MLLSKHNTRLLKTTTIKPLKTYTPNRNQIFNCLTSKKENPQIFWISLV
jgi:hypothetical protein